MLREYFMLIDVSKDAVLLDPRFAGEKLDAMEDATATYYLKVN